ncbi:MAG: DUF6398 domain-containing protein [Coprothermobacterota bacterium]|nr:DUF6398 domain-containing protein [Coprothermobacterota bacterium]
MTDKRKVPKAMQPVFDAVAGAIDEFCEKHLNEEYSSVSQELAAALCRKRPSPLAKGKPEQWACACVYVIGSINFLHDKTQTPHMQLSQLCELFGISKSAATAKALSIKKMMGINYLDPRWTLPSKLEDNSLVWMLAVDGFVVDIRDAPPELQEEAYQRGLIPFIPGKRDKQS